MVKDFPLDSLFSGLPVSSGVVYITDAIIAAKVSFAGLRFATPC